MTEDAVLRWCLAAGVELAEAAERAAVLASAIATDWLDEHGREWTERTQRMRRDLDHAAALGQQLAGSPSDPGGANGHSAGGLDAAADPAVLAALRSAAALARRRGGGPRLGDTDGAHADDGRGFQIAELPDDAGG